MTSNPLYMFTFRIFAIFGNDVPTLWERVAYDYIVHMDYVIFSLVVEFERYWIGGLMCLTREIRLVRCC